MDPIVKSQLVEFYVNIVELQLLRKTNREKQIFILNAFENGAHPSLEKLPLQIESTDIQKSLQIADMKLEEVLKRINQKPFAGTNQTKLRKLVNESTNKVTEGMIDRNKAELNKLMTSYEVNQLYLDFTKAKLSPVAMQTQSKEQLKVVTEKIRLQLEARISYQVSGKGFKLNPQNSNKILIDPTLLKYSHCDYLMYTKKTCQFQRLKLAEKLEQHRSNRPDNGVKQPRKNFFSQLFGKKHDSPDTSSEKKVLKQIKKLEVEEEKIQRKLNRGEFKSGEVSKEKKIQILEMQAYIKDFEKKHSKNPRLNKQISQAKVMVQESYNRPRKGLQKKALVR